MDQQLNIQTKVSRFLVSTPPTADMGTRQQDFVDFSFGNPSEATFPVADIVGAVRTCLTSASLQYCSNRGAGSLLATLTSWLPRWQRISPRQENLVITNGAMDAIALIIDTFVEPGDIIITESPTYWRAKDLFEYAGARILYVPVEEDGVDISVLTATLHMLSESGHRTKLIYTIPNHQNPTGSVMSHRKRQAILALSAEFDFLVIEDDAYSHLTYRGILPPSLLELASEDCVIQIGTLSKLICPGLRIGWVIAPSAACTYMTKLKKDGGTNPFASAVAAHLLNSLDWDERLRYLREFYGQRSLATAQALRNIPAHLASWHEPLGGFYTWIELNHTISLAKFSTRCLELGVGFMSGELCIGATTHSKRYIRLAFSDLDIDQIQIGIDRIHAAIMDSL